MVEQFNRKLILENGEEYFGFGFGSNEERVCELIFNTSVVGYQEIISDPSYAGQAVVMTYPLIGNYGIADDDYESRTPNIGALVVREYNDQPSNFRYTKTLSEVLEENHIPAIAGLDTRKLMRALRDKGACRALITGVETTAEEGMKIIAETAVAHDLVARVSCAKRWYSRTTNHKYNVVCIDCGVALSVIRSLNARGCNVTVVPYDTAAEAIEAIKPDGILVSNGPGNPEDAARAAETVKALRGKYPMFGLGLGHQLIALAFGGRIERLANGHHSSNHAVRILETGKLEIVNQNNDYTVVADSLNEIGLKVTHINIMDNSVAGLECAEEQIFSLQYQPGTTPAPAGTVNSYDKFVAMMKEAKENA